MKVYSSCHSSLREINSKVSRQREECGVVFEVLGEKRWGRAGVDGGNTCDL